MPHRGQLGHASTAGGVAVVVAIVTSHVKNWREHNRSLRHRRPLFVDTCSLPMMANATRQL